MKFQEIILDIIGLCIVVLAMYSFYWKDTTAINSIGGLLIGLSLFLLKSSQIRKLVKKFIKKKID